MSDDIKPCPFCGDTPDLGDPYSFRESQGSKWGALVCCCEGPEVRTGYGPVSDWIKDAVREWNARPLEEALATRIAELEAEVERLGEALRRIPIHHTGRHYALHTARGVFVDDTGVGWISAVGALLRDEEAKP